MKLRILIPLLSLLLAAQLLQAGKKMYELDESINLSELKEKLELFKKTRKVVNDNMGGIMKIHAKHKQTNPKLAGQMIMKLVLSGKGEVTKCKVVKSQLTSKEFHYDAVQTVKEWKFGKLPKEKQEVLIPFFFK